MTLAIQSRHDLAVTTAEAVRDLLDRWREGDAYLKQHVRERNRLAGVHGIFCRDLVNFLVAGYRLILNTNTPYAVLAKNGIERAVTGAPGLYAHWPTLEIELGKVVVDGAVEWKSHGTQ